VPDSDVHSNVDRPGSSEINFNPTTHTSAITHRPSRTKATAKHFTAKDINEIAASCCCNRSSWVKILGEEFISTNHHTLMR